MKRLGILLGTLMLLSNVTIAATTLLNSSYDISRELFSEINPAFEQYWLATTGKKITIKQSHGGSSKQALAILQGLKADVVTYNQVTDVQILHDKGHLIPADWQSRLPNNSSPYYSTMAFLVRKGNPKQIQSWDDLIRDDVRIIFPNPKISGNGRYAYLAALGAANQKNQGDQQKNRDWMSHFLKNVVVFDVGGRAATTSFVERGLADVLINFESEMNTIQQQYQADGYQVIVPTVNIMAEFPVTWIDKNVKEDGREALAKAYLEFLYTPQAQQIIIKHRYRILASPLMETAVPPLPKVTLFRVTEQFASWSEIMKTHFSTDGLFDQLLAQGHRR